MLTKAVVRLDDLKDAKDTKVIMKILLAYIHYPVCSGRYVRDALVRLGHDVKSCGYSTGDQIWGMQVNPKYSHYPDLPLDGAEAGWVPDVVVIMESAWAYHHPIYSDVPHVVYGVDNHVRDYRQNGVAHYFLAHKATSIMDMARDDVTWLPCGYDPVAFTPSEIPFDEREYDVAMIGVMYPARWELLQAMQTTGLEVFGATGLLYDEYAEAYHNSRVSLNISAKQDLNQRIFETAALGCTVVSEMIPDLAEIDYPEGAIIEVELLEDIPQVVSSARPAPATDWLKNHTWDARVQVVIDWYQAMYEKKATIKRDK